MVRNNAAACVDCPYLPLFPSDRQQISLPTIPNLP